MLLRLSSACAAVHWPLSFAFGGISAVAAQHTRQRCEAPALFTASWPVVPSTMFRAHKNDANPGVQYAYGLAWSTGQPFPGASYGKLVEVPRYMNGGLRLPDVPSRVGNFVTRADGKPGDWDTGMGDQKDGAYINKPDEGDARFTGMRLPYILGYFEEFAPPGQTHFSPNRQMPSALMFGSIPTGVQRFKPWQTLLFNPRPEDLTHPGFGTPRVPAVGQSFTLPPDYLMADLFWMPVVEPYAISQPFATSGKINMNYQIQPFTYIRRSTGMHAVMKATKLPTVAPPLIEMMRTAGEIFRNSRMVSRPSCSGM